MKAHCDVLIQGAGIGGLTLAIALQQRGYKVKLVERADGLTEVGAGIWMAANPMQVFSQLGFAEKIIEAGWAVKLVRLQDWKSGNIQTTNISQIARSMDSRRLLSIAACCSVCFLNSSKQTQSVSVAK